MFKYYSRTSWMVDSDVGCGGGTGTAIPALLTSRLMNPRSFVIWLTVV